MVTTLLLVIVTGIKGFKVEENPFFILIETFLNLVIVSDFLCRLKLMGAKRFFFPSSGRLWNWLDACVVVGSLLMFLGIIITQATKAREEGQEYLEEVSEVVLLVIWAAF